MGLLETGLGKLRDYYEQLESFVFTTIVIEIILLSIIYNYELFRTRMKMDKHFCYCLL